MPKRIVVSDGTLAKEVTAVRVVVAAVVKNAKRVVVVFNGISREVWVSP